jgi:hypothetical protein
MMPRKSKPTGHAELDELRQEAADERMKQRDLEAQLEANKAKVEQATAAIAAAYASEDERAVTSARKAESKAIAELRELQHRVDGAGIRVERAQQALDTFMREHPRSLIAEREQQARAVTADLTRAVHQVLVLSKAYISERQTVDQLVAAVPGATPRADGPTPKHQWEPALGQLARAYQQTPELEPPLPRWEGMEQRAQQDHIGRREKLRRKRKLTSEEEQELDMINRELGVSAPSVEVA